MPVQRHTQIATLADVLLLAGLMAAFVAARPAAAESLLVMGQPRTVRGEAAGLYLQEYFPHAGGLYGARIELPGQALRQPIELILGGAYGIAIVSSMPGKSSGSSGGVSSEVALFAADPLRRVPLTREPGWEPVQILCEPGDAGAGQRLAIVEGRRGASPAEGRVRTVRAFAEIDGIRLDAEARWSTPGAPVAAAADWARGRLYVLGSGDDAGAGQLTRIDLGGPRVRSAILPAPPEDAVRPEPAGLALLSTGESLCVLTSAYSLSRGDGAPVSAARWFDAETLETIGGPQEIAGARDRIAPALISGAGGAVWARTYTAATGFAYITEISLAGGAPSKRREEAFRAASAAPRLAGSPDDARVALAGGRSLRIIGGGGPLARSFEQPIEAIVWGESGLFVSEGARVHRIDPRTAESIAVSDTSSGFVVDLCVLASHSGPARGAPERGISLPVRIELDIQTPGRGTRVIPITLAEGTRARLIGADRGAGWLHAELTEPIRGVAQLRLALDEQPLLRRDGLRSAEVRIQIDRGDAAQQIETIEVDSLTRRMSSRAIEWQSPDASGPGFDALMRALAGAPLHLSHRVRRGPFSRPPRGSAAAVVRLEDVARGAITRQTLLDFVSGGGGLLVIAGHTPQPAGEALRRWLEPLGLLIETGEEVSGRFPVASDALTRLGVDQLSIAAGAYMEVTRPMDVCVPGPAPGTAVLALTRYGYGRLGVLASGSPLGDRAMAQASAQRFARALFGWLVGTNTAVRDSDLDGLRDDVEDPDANGTVERGETDWLRDDTDADGVPDGAEDSNLNGLVDEGETDPRRGDTDGDGITDGADAEPLPRSGSPIVLAVQPQTAPAQGGTMLEIAGRNLPLNPQVWFGEHRATHVVQLDSTRIVATPPPRAHGMPEGPMPVRVAHPLGVAESTLERAFTYSGATPIRIALESIGRVQRAYDGYRGSFSLTLELGELQIEHAAFFLRTAPTVMSLSAAFEPGQGLIASGRDATFRGYGPGEFRFSLGPGDPVSGRVELGTLSWWLADTAPPIGKFQWYVFLPDVRVQWGGMPMVLPSESWTDLDPTDAEAVPRPGAPVPP